VSGSQRPPTGTDGWAAAAGRGLAPYRTHCSGCHICFFTRSLSLRSVVDVFLRYAYARCQRTRLDLAAIKRFHYSPGHAHCKPSLTDSLTHDDRSNESFIHSFCYSHEAHFMVVLSSLGISIILLFTHHFSGPGRAISPIYVSVCLGINCW